MAANLVGVACILLELHYFIDAFIASMLKFYQKKIKYTQILNTGPLNIIKVKREK